MKVVVAKPCGIDVHKSVLYVCVLSSEKEKEVRRFATDRQSLLEMNQWLAGKAVTVVSMESTGSYWVPVYEVLEEASSTRAPIELRLCNAEHVSKVPGRKTDVGDAEWLARLTMYGLLSKSFVPPRSQRDLRLLTRTRRSFIENRTEVRNQVLELLETAQIKLSNVVTDAFGATGTAILRALAKGEADPERLAALAKGSLREKRDLLARVCEGKVRKTHRHLLATHLQLLDQLEKNINRLDREAARLLQEHRKEWELLQTLPGLGADASAGILAEIGTDMSIFETVERLASWTGVCPGNNRSAGKKLAGRGSGIRKANQYVISLLIQASWSSVRRQGSRFRAKYYALKTKLGCSAKAIVAVAHSLLRVIFAVLKNKQAYEERVDELSDEALQRAAKHRLAWLEQHGYQVEAKRVAGTKTYALDRSAAPVAP